MKNEKIKIMAKKLSTATTRSVLGSFGAVLMSCKVYFHVVRSALQNSIACGEIAENSTDIAEKCIIIVN